MQNAPHALQVHPTMRSGQHHAHLAKETRGLGLVYPNAFLVYIHKHLHKALQKTNVCATRELLVVVVSVQFAVLDRTRIRWVLPYVRCALRGQPVKSSGQLILETVRCVVTTDGVISVRQNVLIATTILSR